MNLQKEPLEGDLEKGQGHPYSPTVDQLSPSDVGSPVPILSYPDPYANDSQIFMDSEVQRLIETPPAVLDIENKISASCFGYSYTCLILFNLILRVLLFGLLVFMIGASKLVLMPIVLPGILLTLDPTETIMVFLIVMSVIVHILLMYACCYAMKAKKRYTIANQEVVVLLFLAAWVLCSLKDCVGLFKNGKYQSEQAESYIEEFILIFSGFVPSGKALLVNLCLNGILYLSALKVHKLMIEREDEQLRDLREKDEKEKDEKKKEEQIKKKEKQTKNKKKKRKISMKNKKNKSKSDAKAIEIHEIQEK